MKTHYQILIIGGGNAGISVAARLLRANPGFSVAIMEPSEKHYYQPGWTLVGGGVFDVNSTIRNEADYIPERCDWIKDGADTFEPENNMVITRSGERITYDFLIVCCGIQLDWHLVKGLQKTIGRNGVCSNYHVNYAPYTYECIKNFQGGRAVFTQPGSLIKCGAAPQKIMYLAADNFRRRGILEKSEVSFYTGKGVLLRVKEINEVLVKIAARYGVHVYYLSNLKEVNGDAREAVIEITKGESKELVTVHFDMLHVTPPMSAPDFIKKSRLAVQNDPFGWVDVDPETFQHLRYKNVFSIGDVANAGDVKTGAAVRIQAKIMADNLLDVMKQKSIADNPRYDGYTACPLTTAYGKLLLAEFDKDSKLKPSLPLDPRKERLSMWLMMRYIMPWAYWNEILKGKV